MPFPGDHAMNFKKLPKEKRNALILVVIVTVAVLSGLGFGLIKYQFGKLAELRAKRDGAQQKLEKMRNAVKNADHLEADLAESRKVLDALEEDMASGDLNAWVINSLRTFKAGYKVDMPQFSPLGPVTDVPLIPGFPYKQATITVAGQAHFHDFGKFLADFENQHPHIRVLNLTLDGSPGAASDEMEKLNFKMEISTLVKPSAS
jgi:Tfp pilus assembly protein PilO